MSAPRDPEDAPCLKGTECDELVAFELTLGSILAAQLASPRPYLVQQLGEDLVQQLGEDLVQQLGEAPVLQLGEAPVLQLGEAPVLQLGERRAPVLPYFRQL